MSSSTTNERKTLEVKERLTLPPDYPSEISVLDSFASPNTEVQKDKLSAKYVGRANHSHDVGSVRSNRSVPKNVAIYYFEVTVVDGGFKSSITVGLAPASFPLSRQVGSKSGSFGYRGEDGRKFNGTNNKGVIYASFFTTDDVVGCGINFYTKEIFYTKNGRYLETAFTNVKGVLYPTVSLHSPGEKIWINFGTTPFRFNIEGYIRDQQEKVEATMASVEADSSFFLPLLKMYLSNAGYVDTLKALEQSTGSSSESASLQESRYERISCRKHIRQLLMQGSVAEAVAELNKLSPTLLGNDREFALTVYSQQFVELIRARRIQDALDFARSTLSGFPSVEIKDLLSLIAYSEPEKSPVAHLVDPGRRLEVAAKVNAKILAFQDSEPLSPLEILLKHLVATTEELHAQNQEMGEKFDLEKFMQKLP